MGKGQQSQDSAAKQAVCVTQDATSQQIKSADLVHVNGVAVNRVPVDAPADHPSIVVAPKVRLFASEEKVKEIKVSNTGTEVVKFDKKNE